MHAKRTTLGFSLLKGIIKTIRPTGFSLVELIVVITILAILATIGFLALSGYAQDARDATYAANVRSVYAAIAAEAAATNNSPRYYVVHDTGASVTGAVVVMDGYSYTLTGGSWNAPGTNYSAGNPDYAKLRLNPEKFKVALRPLPEFFDTAFAAYDPRYLTVGAADLGSSEGPRKRATNFVQVAAVSPSTGRVAVTGNYPGNSAVGSVAGLVRDGNSVSVTGTLVDGAVSGGANRLGSFYAMDTYSSTSGTSNCTVTDTPAYYAMFSGTTPRYIGQIGGTDQSGALNTGLNNPSDLSGSAWMTTYKVVLSPSPLNWNGSGLTVAPLVANQTVSWRINWQLASTFYAIPPAAGSSAYVHYVNNVTGIQIWEFGAGTYTDSSLPALWSVVSPLMGELSGESHSDLAAWIIGPTNTSVVLGDATQPSGIQAGTLNRQNSANPALYFVLAGSSAFGTGGGTAWSRSFGKISGITATISTGTGCVGTPGTTFDGAPSVSSVSNTKLGATPTDVTVSGYNLFNAGTSTASVYATKIGKLTTTVTVGGTTYPVQTNDSAQSSMAFTPPVVNGVTAQNAVFTVTDWYGRSASGSFQYVP